jgi:flagellar hook protein FlgE
MSLGALVIGTSGLAANSFELDVVGNNLANLNTTGFKDQLTNFQDTLYQTLNPGSAPSGAQGGTNPSQQGSGVSVGAIDSQFAQGTITPTGQPLDAAIQGSGFFVVNNASGQFYTRAGSFAIDANGYLVDPNTGDRVQRTGTVGEGSATETGFQVAGNNDIKVPIGAGIPGTETANVNYSGNLDSSAAVGTNINTAIQVYDSQGASHSLNVTFSKTADDTYSVSAQLDNGATATAAVPAGTTVSFDSNGLLLSPASIPVTISGIPGASAQTVNLNLGTPGESTGGLTQFGGGGTSTANAVTQDGVGYGSLTSVTIDNSGTLQGSFTNGETEPIAQLAIAGFNNQGGLIRSGNNYFQSSSSSGQALIGTAGSGGLGSVEGASLEGSNVDIATEFSRLIIAERGYQVNAETITAADNTLQTLTNIIH